MKLLLLAAAAFPFFAQAVVVKDCPRSLSATYGSIRALSDAEIEKGDSSALWDIDELKAQRDVLAKASPSEYQSVRYTLVESKNSQCRYLAAGEKKPEGDNETRLVTKGGEDLIRVSLHVGNKYFWVYHPLARYSTSGVLIKDSKGAKILGYFDHGAPHTQMGWANQPEIE
jgi:hypothetical protein